MRTKVALLRISVRFLMSWPGAAKVEALCGKIAGEAIPEVTRPRRSMMLSKSIVTCILKVVEMALLSSKTDMRIRTRCKKRELARNEMGI